MIAAGRVMVDGQKITQPGVKADPARQEIRVDGQTIKSTEAHEYWMIHKPAGVVCTVSDPEGRPKVVDLLPDAAKGRLYPVGRLDMYSEGLVLMTNDGELAYKLTHPRYRVPKYYKVWVEGRPDKRAVNRLRQGVEIEGGASAPARVHVKSFKEGMGKLHMVLHEGRKREIRQMCQAIGHPVKRLMRVGLANLRLDDLPLGASRRLTMRELKELRRGLQ